MMAENPRSRARRTYSISSPWSSMTHTGTRAASARMTMMGPMTSMDVSCSCSCACWMMTGSSRASAAPMAASSSSRFGVSNAAAAQPRSSAQARTEVRDASMEPSYFFKYGVVQGAFQRRRSSSSMRAMNIWKPACSWTVSISPTKFATTSMSCFASSCTAAR